MKKIYALFAQTWFRVTSTVVTLDLILFYLSQEKFGFLSSPIYFYIEEMIRGFGGHDLLYYLAGFTFGVGPYILILFTSISFYSFVVGVIVWSIKTKRWITAFFILIGLGTILSLLLIYTRQVAFFDAQCDSGQTGKGIVFRSCRNPRMYNYTDSISKNLFDSLENGDYERPDGLYINPFDGIVISRDELNQIKNHNGEYRYFCDSGCGVVQSGLLRSRCEMKSNTFCEDCVNSCMEAAEKPWSATGTVVDYLKSEPFVNCWRKCMPR